jgi:hypothetical protein
MVKVGVKEGVIVGVLEEIVSVTEKVNVGVRVEE